MIFGNWLRPASFDQLEHHGQRGLFEKHPFERIALCRTVAKVLSMGFDVRRCFQCSAGKS